MHVVVADSLPRSAVDLLKQVPGWTVDARAGRTADALARDLADAAGLIVRSATRVDARLIESAPKLRVIARAGTGVDNVDLAAATSRGVLVMNAPGANSISVAEHAMALMLSLARAVPAADASMKRQVWDKKSLTGAELRGKTLGLVGLGRIGREVAVRARAFGMTVIAHDPFISERIAEAAGVELTSLESLCARADYISLHLPALPETRHFFDTTRFRQCRHGVRIVNTARGELIDQAALVAAIESGQVGGAGLDVFETEPPNDWRLMQLPQVVATPHIAASTTEAQEQVGIETAAALRDFLLDGTVRNAVNFPAVSEEEMQAVRPFMVLGDRLGALAAQLSDGRTHAVGIRHYGPLVSANGDLIVSAAVGGVLKPMLSSAVTIVNARDVAAQRGIEIIESRSSRPRTFANMISLKLHTSSGERWLEGTVFEPGRPRLTSIDGMDVEAPLEGTLVTIRNDDRPGIIGQVGSILGAHGVNIASFALGRDAAGSGAAGIISVDAPATDERLLAAVADVRRIVGVRDARLATLD